LDSFRRDSEAVRNKTESDLTSGGIGRMRTACLCECYRSDPPDGGCLHAAYAPGFELLADAIAQIITDGTALVGAADSSHHSLARTGSLKNQWLADDKNGGRQNFVDATLLSNTVIRPISSMSRSF
jgi:hypothetical protein